MTESQYRGMYKLHTRAERAYRAIGATAQADAARACREKLVADHPEFTPPVDTDTPKPQQGK